jgi:primase-polymerase (primpol)-like protein
MWMKNRRVFAVENIPRSLQERSQWVCWKYIPRPNGKPTKLPFNANKGGQAISNDPNTWTTFNRAFDAFKRDTTYAGIGYVFLQDAPYTGIDLDDCLDEQGEFIRGQEIVDRIDTYCEVSPSGTAVKMILEGPAGQTSAGSVRSHHQSELAHFRLISTIAAFSNVRTAKRHRPKTWMRSLND